MISNYVGGLTQIGPAGSTGQKGEI